MSQLKGGISHIKSWPKYSSEINKNLSRKKSPGDAGSISVSSANDKKFHIHSLEL